MIESCGMKIKKQLKDLLEDVDLAKFKFAGAKVLTKKIDEIK